VFKVIISATFVSELLVLFCFCQYYARGDAWHLPDGAHEAITLLKDAGGNNYFLLSGKSNIVNN